MTASRFDSRLPLDVRLDDVEVFEDNTLRLWVELEEDGTTLSIDLAPDSDATRRVLEALAESLSEALARFAGRRIVITGFTAAEEAGEQ